MYWNMPLHPIIKQDHAMSDSIRVPVVSFNAGIYHEWQLIAGVMLLEVVTQSRTSCQFCELMILR